MDINVTNTNTFFNQQNKPQQRVFEKGNNVDKAPVVNSASETPLFNLSNNTNYSSQLALLNAYAYINITKTPKKTTFDKKNETKKLPKLGQLWEEISQNSEMESFLNNELCFVEIDENIKNIFLAA